MKKSIIKEEAKTEEALKEIFQTKKAPKPEQLDKMVDSWGKIRNPKKK